jgi:hypothetical protein
VAISLTSRVRNHKSARSTGVSSLFHVLCVAFCSSIPSVICQRSCSATLSMLSARWSRSWGCLLTTVLEWRCKCRRHGLDSWSNGCETVTQLISPGASYSMHVLQAEVVQRDGDIIGKLAPGRRDSVISAPQIHKQPTHPQRFVLRYFA